MATHEPLTLLLGGGRGCDDEDVQVGSRWPFVTRRDAFDVTGEEWRARERNRHFFDFLILSGAECGE